MTDRERGGFYASQDADINLDDDGDYFTWTLDEARAVLDSRRTGVRRALLGHRRAGRYAPQPGQECSARESDRWKKLAAKLAAIVPRTLRPLLRLGPAQAACRPRRAAHALYRPHALHRLECDGGHGLP